MRLTWGTVTEVIEASAGRQKLRVLLDSPQESAAVNYLTPDPSKECVAINYLTIAPERKPGDRSLLNMTALDLGLGTGGVAFVVPTDELLQTYRTNPEEQRHDHIMKLRYTPLQREVATIEDQASVYHALMQEARSLTGLPVVCCALASQVPLVAAAIKARQPGFRIVLCMTDEASLMFAFSDILAAARNAGLIDLVITCGQAIGGDEEAITLHSALLAARYVFNADVCIVSIGPGTPGSDTPFGHGGIAQGESLNAVAALDGIAIAALRLSFADARVRHQGVSHHSLTTLGRICLAKVLIPLPTDLPSDQLNEVENTLEVSGLNDRHSVIRVDLDPQEIDLRGLTITTMGRTQQDDPAFFSAAFAAGILAASCVAQSEPPINGLSST